MYFLAHKGIRKFVSTTLIVFLSILWGWLGPHFSAAQEGNESVDLEDLPANILDQPTASYNKEDEAIPTDILSDTSNTDNQFHLPFKLTAETSLQVFHERENLPVPLPDTSSMKTQFIQSADLHYNSKLFPHLELNVVNKLYYVYENGRGIDDSFLENDLREIYVTWSPISKIFIDVGRLNVKNGVAVGFNPTDYFKKDAVSLHNSEDQSVLRENRIGTLMIRGQYLSDTGTLTLAYAPKISLTEDSFLQKNHLFGLGLADLNTTHRFLAKFVLNILAQTKPEILFYFEDNQYNIGINISRGFGNRVITYLEWNGGKRLDVVSQAAKKSHDDGVLPDEAAFVMPVDMKQHFFNQLSFGFSYSEDIDRTTYIEYHYNQAGLSGKDWDAWFNQGRQAEMMRINPATASLGMARLGQLWTIRDWEIEEPLSQHELFVRTYWQNSFMDHLNLSGILKIDLVKGGYYLQPKIEYEWSNALWLTFLCNLKLGPSQSEYGSLPYSMSGQVSMTYHF